MILPVMIFFLFCHTNSYQNSNSSAAFYTSRLDKHRRSETHGNSSLRGVPWNDSLETYSELDSVKLPAEREEENAFKTTSEKKSFHEVLSPLVESPHVSGRPRSVELKENFPYSNEPLQKRQLAQFLRNKREMKHPTNDIQTTRQNQSRQKRFAPPCWPPELPLRISGETATVTKWVINVHVYPSSIPVAVAVFCCYLGATNNLTYSVSSSDLGITSNKWHDLDVRLIHSRPTRRRTYDIQITNLINNMTEVKQFESIYYYNLPQLNVSITGDGVRWYEGPKKHNCSRYPTTTRPAPATTTKGTTPGAEENTTTVAPAVETISAGTMSTDGMSQLQSAQKMITILSSVLGLLVTVVVILVVVIMWRRKKGRVTQDGHKPGDASRSPQGCPAPRQVDHTTFSVSPTATISPLTSPRAGGDAEVEYYEPPECFPISRTSAAYVIFDDDGNPVN